MNLTGTRNRVRNHAGIRGRVSAPCAQALEPRLLFAQEAEPADLETLGPYVLFTQFDVEYGRELWRSDGTPGGTIGENDALRLMSGFAFSTPMQLGPTIRMP